MIISLVACGKTDVENPPEIDAGGIGDVSGGTEDTSGGEQGNVSDGGASNSPSTDNTPDTTPSTTPPSAGIVVDTKLNPMVLGKFYRNVVGADISSNDAATKASDQKADAKLKQIENYPDNISVTGKTYYVSAAGKSNGSGLSAADAVNSYSAIAGKIKAGDAVLFRRGDTFRGQMKLVSGVTYGAYGSGIKPCIYGSIDGKQGKWTETSTKGVYEYNKVVKYANIIFDNGAAIGRPVEKEHITKKKYNVYYNGAKLQVYSPDGNPNDIFSSIEIVEDYTLMTGSGLNNVKLQNLCLMYTGVHFLGSLGAVKGLEVEGCIMGYCGGKNLYLGNRSVSLGNCIEFWSQAVDIDIHDNYFFQAFDAALTHQGPTTVTATGQTSKTDYTNIKYRDNLIEYCTYDIEAFSCRNVSEQGKNPNGTFNYNDVYVTNNICRFTGWGWGSLDRPDKQVYSVFKYDAAGEKLADGGYSTIHVKPLTISGNLFDRPRKTVFNLSTPENNKANMTLTNNQFIINSRITIFSSLGTSVTAKDNYDAALRRFFGTFSGNQFTIIG